MSVGVTFPWGEVGNIFTGDWGGGDVSKGLVKPERRSAPIIFNSFSIQYFFRGSEVTSCSNFVSEC